MKTNTLKKALALSLIGLSVQVFADTNTTTASPMQTQSSDVKTEFAKEWAKVSATIKQQQQIDGGMPQQNMMPPIPELTEEEKATSENRIYQEKLNTHLNKVKKEALDKELSDDASFEVEPQFIEIAGKSEFYIPYKRLLEVKLFFASKEQNKYTVTQLAIQSSELQNITQELQTMSQQDSMANSAGMQTATTVLPSKAIAKQERVWLNKDYGTFIVSKVTPEVVSFKRK